MLGYRRTSWTKLWIGTRELVGVDVPFSVKSWEELLIERRMGVWMGRVGLLIGC